VGPLGDNFANGCRRVVGSDGTLFPVGKRVIEKPHPRPLSLFQERGGGV
jgi:hypothetical protein